MIQKRIGRIIKIALLAIIGVAVFGTLVMQLWNWLMPGLFGWHAIGFWQALGLLHVPRIEQVSTPLPEHCVAPGVQEPAHDPLLHTNGHALPVFCQVPVEPHVCGCWPLHCVAPGVHNPVHEPELQT